MAPIMAEATIVLHWTDGPLWRVNTEKKKEPNHEEVQLVSMGRGLGVCLGVGRAGDGGRRRGYWWSGMRQAKRLVKGLLTMRFMSNSTKDLQHNGERGHNEFRANVTSSEVEESVGVSAVRHSCPVLTNSIGVKGVHVRLKLCYHTCFA